VSSVPDPRTGTQADRNADRSAVTPAVDFNYNLSIKYFICSSHRIESVIGESTNRELTGR
jgi:hypothetical protein